MSGARGRALPCVADRGRFSMREVRWEATTGPSRAPRGGTVRSEPGSPTPGQHSIDDRKGGVGSDTTAVESEVCSKGECNPKSERR